MQQTFSIVLKKKDDALARLYGLFCGRAFRIQSTTVGATEDDRYWRVTLVTSPEEMKLDKLVKELGRLVDVVEVTNLTDTAHVSRQFALIWLQSRPEHRPSVERLVWRDGGQVIQETPVSLTIQVMGCQEDIETLAQALRSYGPIRMTWVGLVAVDTSSVLTDEQPVYQAAGMA